MKLVLTGVALFGAALYLMEGLAPAMAFTGIALAIIGTVRLIHEDMMR